MKKNIIMWATLTVALASFFIFAYYYYKLNRWINFTSMIGIVGVIGCINLLLVMKRDEILDKEVERKETGQFGDADFMKEEEIADVFTIVKESDKYRPPGKLMGAKIVGKDIVYYVDESDKNAFLLAPPGTGKTKRIIINYLLYNAYVNDEEKLSFYMTDVKGEVFKAVSQALENQGYNVIIYNFRDTSKSAPFNMMRQINECMNKYKNASSLNDKVDNFGLAEEYAKFLGYVLIPEPKTETANSFFTTSARGLIVSMILLTSYVGEAEERHIGSVQSLLSNLQGYASRKASEEEALTGEEYVTKIKDLFMTLEENGVDERLIDKCMVHASSMLQADVRTGANVFSTALSIFSNFLDSSIEQVICSPNDMFDVKGFIERPTACFMIVPDETPIRGTVGACWSKMFTFELIKYAESLPEQVLPRKVHSIIEEIGNTEQIPDFDKQITAARGRGIYTMFTLQAMEQLSKVYGDKAKKIIFSATQIGLIGCLSTSSLDERKFFSEAVGTYTGTTYSKNKGDSKDFFSIMPKNENKSSTESVIKKNLIEPAELGLLKQGEFLMICQGEKPLRTHFDGIYDLKNVKTFRTSSEDMNYNKFPTLNYRDVKKLKLPQVLAYASVNGVGEEDVSNIFTDEKII